MPMVNGKKFSYDKKGMAMAKKEAKKSGKKMTMKKSDKKMSMKKMGKKK
jgi:hypothetical protein